MPSFPPPCSTICSALPRTRFTVACGPVAAGVFARMPRLERVINVEKRRFDLHWLTLWAKCVATSGTSLSICAAPHSGLLVPARRRAIMRGGGRAGHRLTHLAGTMGLADPPLPVARTVAGGPQLPPP